jgi:hypothetical protein
VGAQFRSRRDADGGGSEKGRSGNVNTFYCARRVSRGRGRPHGGEGLGTSWGTGVAIGRRGAASTSLELTCTGGATRSCTRQGRLGADERAPATIPGGLNLIRTQIQTDSKYLIF